MMRLHNGNCLEVLKMMIEDEVFVDSIVTDPPYELGFMGRSWDSTGIAFQKETWELCFKVLKPGGHLLAFSGSRTYHRIAVAIEDAGFEIRDQVMWLYGSGFPKSMNIGKTLDKKLGNERVAVGERTRNVKPFDDGNGWNSNNTTGNHIYTKGNSEWEGWGTALKPAHEPLVLARKPLSEKSVVDNVLKHRTGGINIDECRVEGNTENVERKKVVRKSRDENGVWTNNNSGMKAEGSEYADADPRGRFPSNVMHDGSDVVKDIFPNTKSSNVSRERKAGTEFGQSSGWNKHNNVDSGLMPAYGDEGSASRYFYCAKTSKAERNQGLDNFPIKQTQGGGGGIGNYKDDVNSASGKFGSEKAPSKNTHPTVKPIKLMKYLCRLITPKGGTVLDPFMGSGSTGMAAKEENFEFVGIEKEEQYFNIASARIESVDTKSTLEGFYE